MLPGPKKDYKPKHTISQQKITTDVKTWKQNLNKTSPEASVKTPLILQLNIVK